MHVCKLLWCTPRLGVSVRQPHLLPPPRTPCTCFAMFPPSLQLGRVTYVSVTELKSAASGRPHLSFHSDRVYTRVSCSTCVRTFWLFEDNGRDRASAARGRRHPRRSFGRWHGALPGCLLRNPQGEGKFQQGPSTALEPRNCSYVRLCSRYLAALVSAQQLGGAPVCALYLGTCVCVFSGGRIRTASEAR